jgi:hypothetical protein
MMVKELSAQEIFDRVAMHLAKQGKKALAPLGNCVNCNDYGLRCAIGGLLPVAFFRKHPEVKSGSPFQLLPYLKDKGIDFKKHDNLRHELQDIHDKEKVSRWPQKLRGLAKRHGLMIQDWLRAA